jgi:hypothetical protein
MSEEKIILLKVELDVAGLQKNATEAESKLKQLVPALKAIKDAQGVNTIEYKKAQAEVKQYNKQLTDSVKALQLNEKTTRNNSGSINDMREQLSASTIAYNALSKEQRENSEIGGKMQSDIKGISDALKEQESAIGDNRRNVGNYAGSLAELKKELKTLKGEMVGLDAGSEEYQQASEKAGKLGDKIKEVNENVKASSGGTGFEKLSNNMGLIKGDLENMDFAGVSEKMKQMAVISKSMTFKEVIGGLKDMGSSLLSLGKAILANPLFLMVAAIIAVGVALNAWSDSVKQEAVDAQQAHTKAIEKNIEAMDLQAKRSKEISDLIIKRAELEKKTTKEVGDLKLKAMRDEHQNEINERALQIQAITSLAREKRLAETKEDKDAIQEKIDAHIKEANDLYFNQQTFNERYKQQQREINNAVLEEEKAANAQRQANAQKAHDDRLALERRIKDLILEGTDLTIESEEKAIEAKYKFLTDSAEENTDELLRLEKEKNDELTALDLKAQEQAKANLNESYKREIEDAKGQKTVIKELKENQVLELAAIDAEYLQKKIEREQATLKTEKQLNDQKVKDEKITASEIEVISAELELAKVKGSKDEFNAWSNLQFAKIHQIEALAALELENANFSGGKKIKIEKEAALAIQNIQNETFTNAKTKDEEATAILSTETATRSTTALNAAGQLSDSLFQISQNQNAQELIDEQNKFDTKSKLLNDQLANNLITQAQFDGQMSALSSAFNAKESALKEKAFKQNKASQLISATIAAAVGVVNALASSPPPLSFVLAGVTAALGAVQIGLIASQPTPKFAKGGIFGGKSHANGGTRGTFDDGTQIEVEKDEAFVIINKRSTGMLSRLSDINQMGGGVPLMEKGGLMKFAGGGALASQISQPIDDKFNLQNQLIQAFSLIPSPVVLVEDINSAQGNLSRVSNRANF